jgi:Flp pilus assembly protein TadD
MNRIVILLVVVCCMASGVAAQELTDRQRQILRTTIASDGWLTEAEHRSFWAEAPAALTSDPPVLAKFREQFEQHSAAAVRFQRAVWESLKQTLATKRLVKTPDYKEKAARMLSAMGHIGTEGAKAAETMLVAAASGKPITGPDGPRYITDELVDETLAGLEGSLHRFSKLGNPLWQVKLTEHAYPAEHVRLLWDGPFSRKSEVLTTAAGVSIRMALLDFRISESDHVAIGFARLPAPWPEPNAGIHSVLSGTFKGMGMTALGASTSQWRGRLSGTASGSVQTTRGSLHASVRVVTNREQSAVWQFISISAASLPDATRHREALEVASQVDFDAAPVTVVQPDPGAKAPAPRELLHQGQGGASAGSTAARADAASDCEQRENPDRKIKGCTEFIRNNPRNVTAYFNRGLAYDAKNEFDRAIADYNQAIEISPSYADAFRARGRAYRAKKEFGRAIADYSKVIEIDPNDVPAYLARGVAYRNKGEPDRAIADYNKAMEILRTPISTSGAASST